MIAINGSISFVADTVAEYEIMRIRVSRPHGDAVTIEYHYETLTINVNIDTVADVIGN
jgi:hypothetical protein